MLVFTLTNFIYHFVGESKKKKWRAIRDYTVKFAFIYVNVVYLLDLYRNQYNNASGKNKSGKSNSGSSKGASGMPPGFEEEAMM